MCLSYDGAWEGLSGDFVAGWFNMNTNTLSARKFDKISLWDSEITNVVTGVQQNLVWVDMAAHPNANDILIAVADDADTLKANHWSGSSWGTQTQLAANINGIVANSNHLFDIAWEQRPDFDAIITYGSTSNAIQYRLWDSGTNTWQSAVTLPTAVEAKDWHQLASDPNSQNIMLTTVGITDDVDSIEWNGSAWDAAWTSHEASSNDVNWNAWFAYDDEDENNDPPSIIVNSAAQKTNGSGLVDISIDVDDAGLHKAKVQVQYESDGDGACNGPWQNATLAGPATANFLDSGGAPDINNGQAYQVGSGTGTAIVTNFGPNTVQFDWDSKTDLPSGNSAYCLRFIGNDGINDTSPAATKTLTIDNVLPSKPTGFMSMGTTSQIQHLNWTPAADTNFDHYEVCYGEDESDVKSCSGTALIFGPDDFSTLTKAATYHTHILSLTPDTTYYFRIWAVDAFGNKRPSDNTIATATLAADLNTTPIAFAPIAMSQALDGSGKITFNAGIYDEEFEDVLMRIRFSIDNGLTFYNAGILSAEVTNANEDWDDPTIGIDNIFDFQIGKGDAINLNEFTPHSPDGAQLQIVWDSKSVDNQNGGLNGFSGNVILQVAPMDVNGQIGTDHDSVLFFVDNATPVLAEVVPVPEGTSDMTPSYTFTSSENGSIVYGGSCSSLTTSAVAGTNTITFQTLSEGAHSNCSITVTDGFGNASTLLVSPFIVDTTPPSGLTALLTGNSAVTTQILNWTPATDTNFNHYEIWYGISLADVENRTGSAAVWDSNDDAALASIATSQTTITGLAPETTYFYKIWAVDIAENEETVAAVSKETKTDRVSGAMGYTHETPRASETAENTETPITPENSIIENLVTQIRDIVRQIIELNGTITSTMAAFLKTIDIDVSVPMASLQYSLPVRDLEFGMAGQDVSLLQSILIGQGYSIPSGATGRFLWETRAALAAYQSDNGIKPAVGMFGSVTRAQMKAAGIAGIWW